MVNVRHVTDTDSRSYLAYLVTGEPRGGAGRSEEDLIYSYFGEGGSHVDRCADRAYRDLCRTLHGIAQCPAGARARLRGNDIVAQALQELAALPDSGVSQDTYDAWHLATCTAIQRSYSRLGYEHFHLGQGQKWVNMTLKYVYVLGPRKVAGYDSLYTYGHAPIDNKLLEQLAGYGLPPLTDAWSRIDDYGYYLGIQRWIRDHFELPPLDVEFFLWMNWTHRLAPA